MKSTIEVSTSLGVSELIDRLDEEMDHDDLVEFIKALDARQAEWSFTLRLCEYFNDQKRLHAEEMKADEECATCDGIGVIRDGETNARRKCLDCNGTGEYR